MVRFLEKIGYTDDISYREKALYIILLSIILVASTFLLLYFVYVPFLPAIIVHIILISSSILMYIPLKYKKYALVRYLIIIIHLIQLTLAVYVWFPVDTGFGNFYFLVPLTSYLILDYSDVKQRIFAITSSLIATVLYLLSEILPMEGYLYQTEAFINTLFRTLSILGILIPMTLIFTRFARDLFETQRELNFLANTDTLTQIKNRRSMYDTGDEEFAVAKKYHFEFSVILMDIDFFKHVNDTYGHPAGDELLKQFTEKISQNIRKEDCFSRYGGEEFAVLLHRTNQKSGFEIAEKLLNIIRETSFDVNGNLIDITISIGLVQYSDKFHDFDHMMKVVDSALYKAKNSGRNRIVIGE